ncbi:helix-turn-helix domain-containing protein [Streptomyces sp. NA04227]|uniref:helix-turn-helix domain-containing protein n=1 Tax=Streptomyces sp. NA04227 TaxID=2742136 RepID=UPI0034CF3DBA
MLGRKLGGELLRMRETRGLKQTDAAEALTASVAKVAKIERGQVPLRDPDVRALFHLYGQDDPEAIERLLALAKADRERRKMKGWWLNTPSAEELSEYISAEHVARRIRTWQMSFVPGLCQTADYTRSLVARAGSWHEREEAEGIVDIRRKRQERLTGPNPVQLHCVIWEAALRQEVGGPKVMRAQLGRLLDLMDLPNVRVQVLPFQTGAHPCMAGPFGLMSFSETDAMDVVYRDVYGGTVWVENEIESSQFAKHFDESARHGLSPEESAALIIRIQKGF